MSVPIPTVIVGLVVLYFLKEALEPPSESTLRLVFSAAALVLTLAALALSATRAHDERRDASVQTGAVEKYWQALADARTQFRISGVRLLQSGYLLSIGAALLYASRFIADWGGIVREAPAMISAIGLVGKITVGVGAGAGWVGCWWLAKAFWTSQHEEWLPLRDIRMHSQNPASQAGRTEEAGPAGVSPPPEPQVPPPPSAMDGPLVLSAEDQAKIHDYIADLRARAREWEFRFLSLYLVPRTQWLLSRLANLPHRTTVPTLDAMLVDQVGLEERRAMLRALVQHGLITLTGEQIEVTSKGRAGDGGAPGPLLRQRRRLLAPGAVGPRSLARGAEAAGRGTQDPRARSRLIRGRARRQRVLSSIRSRGSQRPV